MIMFACEPSVCGTHGADCSAEPVSAARSDSAYQEWASPTTAGSPARNQKDQQKGLTRTQ